MNVRGRYRKTAPGLAAKSACRMEGVPVETVLGVEAVLNFKSLPRFRIGDQTIEVNSSEAGGSRRDDQRGQLRMAPDRRPPVSSSWLLGGVVRTA